MQTSAATVQAPISEPSLAPDTAPLLEAGTGPKGGPTAVIICHGMGQQAPFETLNGAVGLLEEGAKCQSLPQWNKAPSWNWTLTRSSDEFVKLGEQTLPRAVLQFEGPAESKREVHVYESYWAPLTEGAITLPETMAFLFGSGGLGLLHCLRSPNGFQRWLFGGRKDLLFSDPPKGSLWTSPWLLFGIAIGLLGLMAAVFKWTTPSVLIASFVVSTVCIGLALTSRMNKTSRYLMAAAHVLAALTLINTVAGLAAARLFVLGDPGGVLTPQRLNALTWELLAGAILIALGSISGFILPAKLREKNKQLTDFQRQSARQWAWRTLFFVAVLGLLMGATLVVPVPTLFVLPKLVLIPAWVLIIGVSILVRRFLLQFLGDVAIYASSHTVNRFYKVREEIRDLGRKVFDAVYGAQDDDGRLRYGRVLVVGHSLGSVVAYDSWNSAMNQDLLLGGSLKVAERTPLFLTFGSPLDKFAFLFRNQLQEWYEHREALAAAVQPAVCHVSTRPQRWVNVWTTDDWISGDLNYYDDPRWTKAEALLYGVVNLKDPEACTPGMSHNEYWENTLLPRVLFSAVIDGRDLEAELSFQKSQQP
jgi:hypothetical protein